MDSRIRIPNSISDFSTPSSPRNMTKLFILRMRWYMTECKHNLPAKNVKSFCICKFIMCCQTESFRETVHIAYRNFSKDKKDDNISPRNQFMKRFCFLRWEVDLDHNKQSTHHNLIPCDLFSFPSGIYGVSSCCMQVVHVNEH